MVIDLGHDIVLQSPVIKKAAILRMIFIFLIDRYRRKRDRLVELAAAAPIPTMWGPFKAYCYRSLLDGIEHIAMVKVSYFIKISSHL